MKLTKHRDGNTRRLHLDIRTLEILCVLEHILYCRFIMKTTLFSPHQILIVSPEHETKTMIGGYNHVTPQKRLQNQIKI